MAAAGFPATGGALRQLDLLLGINFVYFRATFRERPIGYFFLFSRSLRMTATTGSVLVASHIKRVKIRTSAISSRMVKKIERVEKARLAASPSLFGLPSRPSR
jgi:hypothetical protein